MLAFFTANTQGSVTFPADSPHACLLKLGDRFGKLLEEAATREGKAKLAREKRLQGNKFIHETIAFSRWFRAQSTYLIECFFKLNPYYAERTLLDLPKIGARFPEFMEILEDCRGEDGCVTLKQIRDTIRQFLPAKTPRPKFDAGNELTEEHLTYFRKKLIGKNRKPEKIAEKEGLFHRYLSVTEGIADGQTLRVEHLAEAIARCGDDPNAVLPRPSRQFTTWNTREFTMGNPSALSIGNSEIGEPENGKPALENDGNDGIATDDRYDKKMNSFELENDGNGIATSPKEGENLVLPYSSESVEFEGSPAVSNALVPDIAGRTLDTPLRPGVKVRATGSGEVGRISRKMETGWLVSFQGGLTRILPDERLMPLPNGGPVENVRPKSKSKSKNSKKKGFGLLIA